MATLKIFAYKGNLGATSDMNGNYLNDVNGEGQLGVVVTSSEVEISPEAKELLRHASREGGSFAAIMLTKHANPSEEIGNSSVGVLGFGKHHFGKDITIGRDCDLSVLDDLVEVNDEAPEDYKAFIDANNL